MEDLVSMEPTKLKFFISTSILGEPGQNGPPGRPGICPDCSSYQAAYAYPLLLAQQQQNNKGPQNYNNKGPQNYYNNKGP